MSTVVTNRLLLKTGDKTCSLLMMIGEQHKHTLKEILLGTSCPSLTKYFFMYLFEGHETFHAGTDTHFHIIDWELAGEGFNHPTHGILWPIKAELNINESDYKRLREQACRGKGFTFPEYTRVDR